MDTNISEHYKDYNRWKKRTKRNGKCYKWNKATCSGWIEYFDKNGNRREAHVKRRELSDLNGFLHEGALVRFHVLKSEKGPFAVHVELRKDIICHNCRGIGHVARNCKSTPRNNQRSYFTARWLQT